MQHISDCKPNSPLTAYSFGCSSSNVYSSVLQLSQVTYMALWRCKLQHCTRTFEAVLSASLIGAGAEVAQQASLFPLLWTNRRQKEQSAPRGIQTGRPQRDVCMEARPSRAEVDVFERAQSAVGTKG